MERAINEIKSLIACNALHRNGTRMSDVADVTIIRHAIDEINELLLDPDNPEELADVFGCLLHYAVKKDWPLWKLEELVLAKFDKRFVKESYGEMCQCVQCIEERRKNRGDCSLNMDLLERMMVVCDRCGNKRCPHASDHNNLCTGSNDLGQAGSVFQERRDQGKRADSYKHLSQPVPSP